MRHSDQKGPVSLNICLRRKTVADINQQNKEMGKIIAQTKSIVPDSKQLVKHNERHDSLLDIASTRQNGRFKLDPLVQAQKNFSIATSRNTFKPLRTTIQSFYPAHMRLADKDSGYKTVHLGSNKSNSLHADKAMMSQTHGTKPFLARDEFKTTIAIMKLPFNVSNMHRHSVKSKLNQSTLGSTKQLKDSTANIKPPLKNGS